jgi:hypothetical protein
VKPASNLVNHPNEVWLDNGEEMVVTTKKEHLHCCHLQIMQDVNYIHEAPNCVEYKPTWSYMMPCGRFETGGFHYRMKLALVMKMAVILVIYSVC